MPYKSNDDLPKKVKDNIPQGAQTIYRKAYNNANKEYRNPDKRRGKESLSEVSSRVAWSAVKMKYAKKGGKWSRKS